MTLPNNHSMGANTRNTNWFSTQARLGHAAAAITYSTIHRSAQATQSTLQSRCAGESTILTMYPLYQTLRLAAAIKGMKS